MRRLGVSLPPSNPSGLPPPSSEGGKTKDGSLSLRPPSKKKRVYGRNMVSFPDANCAGGPVSLDRLGRRKNRLPAALRRSRGAGQIARGPRCGAAMAFPQKRPRSGGSCRRRRLRERIRNPSALGIPLSLSSPYLSLRQALRACHLPRQREALAAAGRRAKRPYRFRQSPEAL